MSVDEKIIEQVGVIGEKLDLSNYAVVKADKLAIQEGKPAEMAEKIAMGRLNKFFQENTLLSQQFVRDNKLTVDQFLSSTETGLTVLDFKRFSLS